MNKIEELIQKLCPEGVAFKELGEVIKLEKGKQLNKELLSENGAYPAYNGGISYSGFTDNYNYNENTIIISQGGASAGFVNFVTTKFYANAHCFVVLPKIEIIKNKYVFHFLKLNQENLTKKQHGAGIPALRPSEILELLIPLPPLPIQQEIVNILDKFTELEAELEAKLTAELEARKKQYEYYRNNLLTPVDVNGRWMMNGKEVEWKTIDSICKNITSGGTPLTSNTEYYNGNIPWLRTQEVDWLDIYDTKIKITEIGLKNSSAKWIPANCVIVAMYGATAAKVGINKIPLTTNQACCNLEINEEQASHKYVFYWLCKEYLNLKSLGEGSQSNINGQKVKNYKIPIPPLAEQERIVAILEKFDALVNDISSGIPAEIAARRKQYEYYRSKLLSFKEKP